MADGIDGEPGVMSATAIPGPTGSGGYLVNSSEDLVPGMAEGRAFVTKDGPATRELTKFVGAADIGFRAYTNTATNAGHDYLGSDEAGAEAIRSVENITRNYV